ncbi:hypothetical protein HRbin12_01774 [bacterium HR12]|nr:hypothetical protein HRbin12_01774 [bacterium HR12]
MMLIHLVGGIAAVGVAAVAGTAFLLGWPRGRLEAVAAWTLGLLSMQAASGMFLLTAGDGGAGLLHVGPPLLALALAGAARLIEPTARERNPILGAAFAIAALGGLVALVTGLTSG